VARVFRPLIGTDWIVGVVGALQFEILADRIRTEYGVPVRFEPSSLHTARWVEAEQPAEMKQFLDETRASIAEDHNGDPVFLARNAWHLDRAQQDFPKLKFLKIKEQPH
jgi:peptide chain release factor 3